MKLKQEQKRIEETFLDVGNKGDLILVELDRQGYRFGKLKGVGKSEYSTSIGEDVIKFSDCSYNLRFNSVMGVDFPALQQANDPRQILSRHIKNVFVGLDNIVEHLQSHPIYTEHADLIRKIAEAQRK